MKEIKSLLIKIIIKVFLIIIALTLMCAAIMIISYISYKNNRINEKNPQKIFEIKFNFELPSSAEIINFTYEKKGEDLNIKILFDSDDYDYLMDNIKRYINNRGSDPIERKEPIPYFENTCSIQQDRQRV